ncbi:MAG: MogA/MoaB family molybdenum cofactor biosynthesis protein [Spirochaetia bacterium]|jgi:molybdopterin adenylyltransferase|nr:MogA/MoaB family molybdenum cofactor biosynthesis protein [Spirochaetia bacterium]
MKVAVITISDRASKGIYEDLSGSEIEKILNEIVPSCLIERKIVPDEKDDILKALKSFAGYDFILTTGGTGIGPRDVTPNVTEEYCDRELPGISETLRAESLKETNSAMLSRGYSGMKDNTVIVNFPGSVKAVRLCTKVIAPVMIHAVKMIKGEGH